MAAIDINTIKAAIRVWVIAGSGLAGDKVIWSLGKRAPSGSYIHLRLHLSLIGNDWTDNVVNPTPSPGAPGVVFVRGGRYGMLTITCFSADDTNAGTRSPEQILNDVLTASSLPSVNAGINAAKIGILSYGDITPVDLTIDTVYFEPRAYVDVRFHTVAQLSETTEQIAGADVVGTVGADTLTIPIG